MRDHASGSRHAAATRLLALDVRAKVREHEERVRLDERLHERSEQSCVAIRELTVGDERQCVFELGVAREHARRLVPGSARLDLCRRHPEEEEVLGADRVTDLDVRAVERADRERAVHRELHVPRARGLEACGRDLLREIDGRVDALRVLHVEVRNEDHAGATARPDGSASIARATPCSKRMMSLAMR